MTFGDRLKYYREAKGLTQEQLALQIGVAKTTITGYEKGNREPDVAKIKKLSAALCISANELLGLSDIQEKPTIQADDGLTDQQRIAIEKIKNMSPEDLKKKMAALNAVLDM